MAEAKKTTEQVTVMVPQTTDEERVHLTLTMPEAQLIYELLGKCNGAVPENFYNVLDKMGMKHTGKMNTLKHINLIETGWNRPGYRRPLGSY